MATIPEAFAVAREHHQAGRLQEAERIYRLILEQQPEHPDALRLLGVVALQVGRYDAAVELLQQVLSLAPNSAEASSDLGLALQGQGKIEEAQAAHAKAIALKPEYPEAYNNMGLALQAGGRFDEAIAAYKKALELKPIFPLALNNLGTAFQAYGKPQEAVSAHQAAISQAPNYPEAHYNLGLAYQEQRNFKDAAAAYEQAIVQNGNYVQAHNNLGIVLHHQGDYEAAIERYHQALAINPQHAEAWNNLGLALQALGRMDEAFKSFARATDLKPDYVDAFVNRAHCLLLGGDLRRGFIEYESRWRRKDILVREFPQPLWDGSEMKGRTILLHAEQGLGDTIQFIRYAQLVAERGGRVLVECEPGLVRLIRTVPGVEQVVPQGGPLPDFDLHVPLLSLPRIFETTVETIPCSVPYMAPPQSRKLPSPGKTWLKVGIAWAGRPEQGNDRNRSCPVRQFLKFKTVPEVVFYNLQKGPQAEGWHVLEEQLKVQNVAGRMTDMAATASVIAQLDVIITVDTAIAHLAGALGQPVWTMLSFVSDWRWLRDREDTPWYPTMRLFRQPKLGDWDSVFTVLRRELKLRSS
jgi:tetratricopeptide (TPR) repeat protein